MLTAILSRHYALTVKRSSVTLATIALLVCVVSPSYAQIPNNGNLSAQEYGDAVYRQIDSFWLNFFGADYNHTAIFAGLDSGHVMKVVEATGQGGNTAGDTTTEIDFSDINGQPSLTYDGAYTENNRTLTFSDRKNIVATAVSLVDAYIQYYAYDAIDYYSGGNDVSHIQYIRCDGLVEYCYNANGYVVWWPTANPSHWNILSYPDEHNNAPTPPTDPSYEFSPWAQRGAPGGSFWGPSPGNTYMTQSSVIKLPTYQVTQVAGNGYVDVTVAATDESGIHFIGYKMPGDVNWSYSPTQPQHPTSDTYSYTVRVTTSGSFYTFAEDNGGNFPSSVTGYTITVVTCNYAINPTNATPTATDGGGSVNVTAGTGCGWTAISNAGWLTITSGGSGTGNGGVNYTVASNVDCVSRSGTLTIAGQTFTVTQAVGSGSYSLSPTSRSHSAAAESGSFTVTASANCSWAATSSVSWVHTTSAGMGSGTVNYTADANFGVARSAVITVQGQAFSADQAGNILAAIGNTPVVALGDAMIFAPAMIGITSNSTNCSWDFGGGQTSVDCEPSHVFSNCGPQEVIAIVSDGIVSVTNSLTVSVACAFSQLPKPVSLKMKSNFAPGKLDSATFKAFLDMPLGFTVTNTQMSVEVAGVTVPFTLNAKGQAVNVFSTIKLTHKGSATSTVWQVSAQLKGDWDADWQNYGLTNATVTAMPITVPVLLLFNTESPESFLIDKPLLYKARAGKSGTGY